MLDKEELKSQVAVSSVAEEAEVKTVLAAPEIQPMPAKEDVGSTRDSADASQGGANE